MTLFSAGGGGALAADMALACIDLLRAAEQRVVTAGQRRAVQQAERMILASPKRVDSSSTARPPSRFSLAFPIG